MWQGCGIGDSRVCSGIKRCVDAELELADATEEAEEALEAALTDATDEAEETLADALA